MVIEIITTIIQRARFLRSVEIDCYVFEITTRQFIGEICYMNAH